MLGTEATLRHGKVQAREGAQAKLTFGPSRFAPAPIVRARFVVVYDQHASQRPMWLVSPSASLEQLRMLDAQDCRANGVVVGRNKR